MASDKEKLISALRELIGAIYKDCKGTNGAYCYEGQYEKEMIKLVELIDEIIDEAEQRGYNLAREHEGKR